MGYVGGADQRTSKNGTFYLNWDKTNVNRFKFYLHHLGIADRHNDNIMVRTNGQLFHIDFGHFLGNYKQKWGIKRERVPMVLPAEFVEVISTSEFGLLGNFEFFRKLCEEAFLTIRRRASLIIRYVQLSQEIPPYWYKSITKTMQLWIISLAWASVLKGYLYSLTILVQFLIPKINKE